MTLGLSFPAALAEVRAFHSSNAGMESLAVGLREATALIEQTIFSRAWKRYLYESTPFRPKTHAYFPLLAWKFGDSVTAREPFFLWIVYMRAAETSDSETFALL